MENDALIPLDDSFIAYLVDILSLYEAGPHSGTVPSVPDYAGPKGSQPHQADMVLRSIDSIARRMWRAEQTVTSHNLNTHDSDVPAMGQKSTPPSDIAPSVSDSQSPSNDPSPEISSLVSSTASALLDPQEELDLLKVQIRDTTQICSAISRGDLDQEPTVPTQGVMLDLNNAISSIIVNLKQTSSEITRASRIGMEDYECCSHGPVVPKLEGVWEELPTPVYKMAADMTKLIRSTAKVTKAVALGDLSKQIEIDVRGESLDMKHTVNGMVFRLRVLASELTRVTGAIALNQGKANIPRVDVPDVEGVWQDLVTNVNAILALEPSKMLAT